MPTENHIKCPRCGISISIDDALTRQIEGKVKKQIESNYQKIELELHAKRDELSKFSEKIATDRKNIDAQIANAVEIEKLKIVKDAKLEAEKKQNAVMNLLEEQLKSKERELQEATEKEITFLKEKSKLQEDKRAFELTIERKYEEEKSKILESTKIKADEKYQYTIAQLKKQLTDATKTNNDLARKLEQGSQQTQGEVLELELEEILKTEFPSDEITPVPIGVTGADIIQKVFGRSGKVCGQIIWEAKKTKSWNNLWLQKLKDDQRRIKADMAIIVSVALPADVKGYSYNKGIWICDPKLTIPLATALRMQLEAVTREKSLSVGKKDKMDILFNYLTGIEFKQRVEAIIEAFTNMEAGLKKERVAYEKIWAEREMQLKKMITNTAGMYGDLSGLIALPQIRRLDLD